MNIPVFYSLVGGELGLVVSIGGIVVRHALRKQEIRHCAMAIESLEPALALTHEQRLLWDGGKLEAVEVPVATDAVANSNVKQRVFAQHETEWLAKAKETAKRLCAENGDVSSDEIWGLNPPVNGISGQLIRYVFDDVDWEVIGTRRARSRNRDIRVWRLKSMARAA